MTTDKAPCGLSGWLYRRMQAAKQQSWLAPIWRSARRSPFLHSQAAKLRAKAAPAAAFAPPDNTTLTRNERFIEARDAAHPIEGMFTDFSMAVVDSLLSLQEEAGVAGNMLEFGVYKGRSAALLGRRLAGAERLVLVDINDYLERAAIAPFRKAVDFLITPTENFKTAFAEYERQRHAFRFIHIDASHDYRATFNELEMADALLGDRGIIAMDDFVNLNYSQNLAAIFKYLHTAPTDLVIFLVTNEKGYLCRRAAFAFYAGFVLERLIAEMGSREIDEFVLARTDVDPDYGAIYARGREPGETGHHYGLDVEKYRNNFRQP